jgi:hypothetical protein
MQRRVAFSGQFGAGKDYVAAKGGFRILSFAEPMYRITESFFGHCDKSRPDVRKFLQTIGQMGWGFNHQNEAPCTVERAAFIQLMRDNGMGLSGFKGPWSEFGKRKDFWVKILIDRLADFPEHDNVAVTNLRFEHEEIPLIAAGFDQWLVLCSEETRRERAEAKPNFNIAGYIENSNDISERYAKNLAQRIDDDFVIWNDHREMPAGRNFLTINQFLERYK